MGLRISPQDWKIEEKIEDELDIGSTQGLARMIANVIMMLVSLCTV